MSRTSPLVLGLLILALAGPCLWSQTQVYICPCVDSVCVDLRGVDASHGDRAVLWGRELSVDAVAGHAGTISYELLCHTGNSAGLV